MATTNVNNFDTIEEWRLKTNELGVKIADLDNNLFTVNVIASGNITASGNINALGNVVVTKDVRISNNVFVTGVTELTGNVTASSNLNISKDAIVTGNITTSGNVIVGKDAMVTGNVTTSSNVIVSKDAIVTGNISSSGNIVVTKDAIVTGNVTTSSNVIVSKDAIVTGNIIGFSNAIVTGNIIAANVLANVHYGTYVTNKPAINLTFTGDVTGSGGVNLSNPNTNSLSIGLTVAPDSVALGNDTTGDYVQSLSSADAANIIVNNGTGESSTPTINLAMTAVTPGEYGNANVVSFVTVTRDGRITSASNVLIDRSYSLTTKKPSINLLFAGNIVGNANLLISSEGTNFLSISANVANDSVTLGTHTVGDYVKTVSGTSGRISSSVTTGEGAATVIDLVALGGLASTQGAGNANLIPAITYDQYGRVTGHSNVAIDRAYGLITNKPSFNVLFAGNIVGNANLLLSSEGTNQLTVYANVAYDSVTLGTHTLGDYVKTVSQGSGIAVTGGTGEGSTPTIALATSGVTAASHGNANMVSQITVDTFGRITSAANVLIDRRYITVTEKPAINLTFTGDATGTGGVLLTNSGTNDLSISMTVSSVGSGTLPTTTVTPGTYGGANTYATFTVDNTGRLTAASNVALADTGVTAGSYGNANTVSQVTVDSKGRVTAASNILIDRKYGLVTDKPSMNVRFLGNIVGNANLLLSSEGTNFLEVYANVAADSVTLGTHTIGNYVKTVAASGTGIVVGTGTGEGVDATIAHASTSTLNGTYGSAGVSSVTVDSFGHVTAVGTATYLTSVPVITLGSGTNGNYTDRILPGSCITVSGTADEGNVITINHLDTSTLNGLQGGSGIASITVDDRGHVTAVTTATYCTSVPVSSNVFSYFGGATGNTISQTNQTHLDINTSGFNFFAGRCAGNSITSGSHNVAMGNFAGFSLKSSQSVVAIGDSAGYYNCGGSNNNFFGCRAGYKNTTGAYNNFFGRFTGQCNTSGSNNTFLGSSAGSNNTLGSNNIFIGCSAGTCNTTGCRNIVFGRYAGNITTGCDNIIFGCLASCAGLTGDTSNVIIMATGGIQRFKIDSILNNILMGESSGCCISTGSYNIIFGLRAGVSNSTGSNNFFAGRCAGNSSTSSDNIHIGLCAGKNLTAQSRNVFLGVCAGHGTASATGGTDNFGAPSFALRDLSSGSLNAAVGYGAGLRNNTGSCNSFFGHVAGCNITSGSRNIFLGSTSGGNVTTGNDNIIFGCLTSCVGLTDATSNVIIMATGGIQRFEVDPNLHNFFAGTCAGFATSTGSCNTFIGYLTGQCHTTGIHNTFIGYIAGANTTFGSYNFFTGRGAGYCNTTGGCNIFLGRGAGNSNTIGNNNLFFGYGAGFCNISGNFNLFSGMYAGKYNCTGCYNIFEGERTGFANTTGCCNIFIGRRAGYYNSNGNNNTFLGAFAGYKNTSGGNNNFFGLNSGYYNTTGANNNFFGLNSGYYNTTGGCNVFLGTTAGCKNTTGCFNVFIGINAGRCNTTGNNNIFLGCGAGYGPNGLINNTTGCNQIVLGNSSHTVSCIQTAWTVPSDIRDKCIFGPVPHGKSFLNNINPITFSFKNRETNELKDNRKRYGFSAQEVLAAEGEDPVIVGTDNPEKLGFTSDFIIPILVNAVKELTKDVEELRAEIAELKKSR